MKNGNFSAGNLNKIIFLDGNAAGTGPGDQWTGGGTGVQPPYSGYGSSHLVQSAYPMHIPHDSMVRSYF